MSSESLTDLPAASLDASFGTKQDTIQARIPSVRDAIVIWMEFEEACTAFPGTAQCSRGTGRVKPAATGGQEA